MKRWFKVCRARDLPPGRAQSVSIGGQPFAVFNVNGELRGMEAACGHMKANLAAGRVTGDVVECAMHGWKYCVSSGECLNQSTRPLRTFAAKTEDEHIWIELNWPLIVSDDEDRNADASA
ncbi:MAG: Rieske 2Fe-2S domain-containing protein [bacterium]|nr:Rieske 2Fe-2S domain-containing protein [bacterium]